jgi:peptidoglycan/LPS O-acetylase OafA/YrhL
MRLLGAVERGLSRPSRRPDIEGLRGIVVSAAVAYHLVRLLLAGTGSWGEHAPSWLWWAGTTRFAVDAFFVLAGVFVTTSWWGCRRQGPTLVAACREFGARRARRILPAFWAAAAAFGIPAFVAGRIGLVDLGLLATTQQYLRRELPALVDLPLWSLTTEVQFYLLLPALAVLARRLGGVPLLLGSLVLSTVWVGLPHRAGLAAGLLPGRLSQFVAGMVVAELVQRVRAGERPWAVRAVTTRGVALGLVAVLVGLGTFHGATFQRGEDTWLEHGLHPVVGVVLAAIVLRMLTGSPVPALEGRGLRFLGLISYSLFLWHYPILQYGLEWLDLAAGTSRPVPAVLLGVTAVVAVALVVSVLSYAVVEHRFANRRPRRTVPETVPETAPDTVSGPAVVVSDLTVRTSS